MKVISVENLKKAMEKLPDPTSYPNPEYRIPIDIYNPVFDTIGRIEKDSPYPVNDGELIFRKYFSEEKWEWALVSN